MYTSPQYTVHTIFTEIWIVIENHYSIMSLNLVHSMPGWRQTNKLCHTAVTMAPLCIDHMKICCVIFLWHHQLWMWDFSRRGAADLVASTSQSINNHNTVVSLLRICRSMQHWKTFWFLELSIGCFRIPKTLIVQEFATNYMKVHFAKQEGNNCCTGAAVIGQEEALPNIPIPLNQPMNTA